MNQAARSITEKNFEVFKNLMEEVHLKTHGKQILLISEKAADDIAQVIEDETGKSITGKTIQKFTNAVLENDFKKINPKLYTLHCLAEYVMKENGSTGKESETYPHWYYYEKKHFTSKESSSTSSPAAPLPLIKDPVSISDIPSLARRDLAQACMVGGLIAGTVNALLVILAPKMLSGYFNYPDDLLFQMIPLICIANIGGATILGWFCGYMAWKPDLVNSASKIKGKEKLIIAVVVLVAIIFFKQMASRPRTTEGGNWGSIDFETLAYYFVALIGIVNLILSIRIFKLQTFGGILKSTGVTVVKAIIPLLFAYCIFKFLIENTRLHFISIPSDALPIFHLNYSHPERILLVIMMSFASVFCVLTARNFIVYKSAVRDKKMD